MSLQNKTINDPDLKETLRTIKRDIFKSLHCVMVGKIQIFDGAKKTAQIQLMFKRVLPDSMIMDYPVLVDCPVFTLQGGGGAIQFPIKVGDTCIVLFNDRNLDSWFATDSAQPPYNSRCHDLSDGIALVGINASGSSLAAAPTTLARFAYAGGEIDLMAGGIIKIFNQTTTLLTLMNLLITAIEGITVTGNLPLTAPAIAALEVVKTQMALLLL